MPNTPLLRYKFNIIEDMAAVAKEQNVLMTKNSDCNMFTLKYDETRDKNNVENVSVVLRSVSEGKVHQHLLDITELKHDELDAKSMSNKIITEIFVQYGLDPTSLVSQCYDGASVMSEKRGRVQKLFQDIIHEKIAFVHCFNHQIQLVITNALKRDDDVRRFLHM